MARGLRPAIAAAMALLLLAACAVEPGATGAADGEGTGAPAAQTPPPAGDGATTGPLAATPTPSGEPRALLWPAEVAAGEDGSAVLAVWVDPGGAGVSAVEVSIVLPEGTCRVEGLDAGPLLGPDPLVGYAALDLPGGRATLAAARAGETIAPTAGGVAAVARLACPAPLPSTGVAVALEVALADARFQTAALASVTGGRVLPPVR